LVFGKKTLIRIKKCLFSVMSQTFDQWLLQSEFFGSLSPGNRSRLAVICRFRGLDRHEALFHEGDRGECLYLCLAGSIRVFKTTSSGQEVVLKVIRPGEIFAETILFELDRYPATAVAMEKSRVAVFQKPRFLDLLDDPGFRADFITCLMGKLRHLADQVKLLTVADAETRFFRFLTDRYGGQSDIRTALSKKDVAAAIGTTPETLSRILQRLRQEGRLIWERGRIRFRPQECPPASSSEF
jgi:CRP/FNR family transcriptional regulator, dissimilatory nitrate respiration regulator